MHPGGIWNDWKLQRKDENNLSKACILAVLNLKRFGTAEKTWNQCLLSMHSDGIWNDLELQKKKKTMSLEHALWRYLKRFGTAENNLKTRTVNGVFWRLTIVESIWNFRRKKNVSKSCIVTGCETIRNCRKNENKR